MLQNLRESFPIPRNNVITFSYSFSYHLVFDSSYQSARAVQQWKNRTVEKITMSSILNPGNKKRKVLEVNENSEDNDETPTKRQM